MVILRSARSTCCRPVITLRLWIKNKLQYDAASGKIPNRKVANGYDYENCNAEVIGCAAGSDKTSIGM